MKKISVIALSYHQKELNEILIRSFEKNKPEDLEITYYIVENSNDTSYKEHIQSLAKNVSWHNNPAADVGNASIANGMGIEFIKNQISDEYVFVCHNDVAVTDPSFFSEFFEKIRDGYELVGVVRDNIRINAVHVSGYMVKTELLQQVNIMPNMPALDVGDRLTEYCRQNDIKYYVFRNTHNDPELWNLINEPFKSLGKNCGVDRCLNSQNDVMFVHLGRGAPKMMGVYSRRGKMSYHGWVEFAQKEIL